MIKELLKEILIKYFPWAWIKRKIYSRDIFEEDIKISPRVTEPIIINISSEIPCIDMYLEIENRSQYCKIIANYIQFELWVRDDNGIHLLVGQNYILLSEKIEPKKCSSIFRRLDLTNSQIELLNKAKKSKDVTIQLKMKAYIQSPMYDIIKNTSIENLHCKIYG